MMYQALAKYYDALVKDEEATKAWVDFIHQHIKQGKIMEVACGSGEITIALAKMGYQVYASDISNEMIEMAKQKEDSHLVSWHVMDMRVFDNFNQYDGIICLCDSFNYLVKDEEVISFFKQVYEHLVDNGTFIVDMHSMDRLEEFKEEYNEAGKVLQREYQWTIQTIDDCIYQNFMFYDEDGRNVLEQHVQRVYKPSWIQSQLETIGFEVSIMTDFIYEGICEGEKQFYICKKVKR